MLGIGVEVRDIQQEMANPADFRVVFVVEYIGGHNRLCLTSEILRDDVWDIEEYDNVIGVGTLISANDRVRGC